MKKTMFGMLWVNILYSRASGLLTEVSYIRKKKSVHISFQIYSLLLQGRVNDVRDLLAQHPDKQAGEYDVSMIYCNLL